MKPDAIIMATGATLIIPDKAQGQSEVFNHIEALNCRQEIGRQVVIWGLMYGAELALSLAGNDVIKDTIWGYLIRVLVILLPCAIILVLLVFYLVLRKGRLTVLSIVPAGLGALWTFGTIFWSGQDLNLVTVLCPLFILVIGSAYGLHYVSHFLDNLDKYPDCRELTVETLGMVGTPIFLATITTMAGFASLTWTEVVPMPILLAK